MFVGEERVFGVVVTIQVLQKWMKPTFLQRYIMDNCRWQEVECSIPGDLSPCKHKHIAVKLNGIYYVKSFGFNLPVSCESKPSASLCLQSLLESTCWTLMRSASEWQTTMKFTKWFLRRISMFKDCSCVASVPAVMQVCCLCTQESRAAEKSLPGITKSSASPVRRK